jgi:hypothetical protein
MFPCLNIEGEAADVDLINSFLRFSCQFVVSPVKFGQVCKCANKGMQPMQVFISVSKDNLSMMFKTHECVLMCDFQMCDCCR